MLTPTDLIERPDAWEQPLAVLKSLVDSDGSTNVATTRHINATFGDDLARLILQSAENHLKARRKFGDGYWWTTPRSLQQSTPRLVARLKASWWPSSRGLTTGPTPECENNESRVIADLCCGIGGDAMEISLRSPVALIDQDPWVLAAGVGNVLQCGGKIASARIADVEKTNLQKTLAQKSPWHIDPDRRSLQSGGKEKRTTSAADASPSWSWIAEQLTSSPDAMIKLAPATTLPPSDFSDQMNWHRAWISTSSGVTEQTVLTGDCVASAGLQPKEHSAWIVRENQPVRNYAGEPTEQIPVAPKVGEYLCDPDAAVRASGLTATAGNQWGLGTLAGPMGFLTGNTDPGESFPGTFGRVIWSGSMDDRKLRREFRRHDAFAQVIKARGVDSDTSALEKRYRDLGSRPVTLWLGRRGKSRFAAMTEG